MKSTFSALCIISIIFLSCANDRKSESSTTSSPTFEVAPSSPVIPGAASVPPAGVPSATTTATTGLNPAHGQPGHRCDIAVGAPLNSAPSASVTPPSPTGAAGSPSVLAGPRVGSIPSPAGTAPSFNTQQGVTAPGMNPPHGQPGHDCSIAVGAPLKK
jgi:hypothetical protein